MEKATRKELMARYKEMRFEAGIYRIVNSQTGCSFLGSSADLKNEANKMEFARKTGMLGVFDLKLAARMKTEGLENFRFEVLETLEDDPEAKEADVKARLEVLEMIWREKLGLSV